MRVGGVGLRDRHGIGMLLCMAMTGRMIDRLTDPLVRRSLRLERCLVDEPRRKRSLMLRDLGGFALVVAAWLLTPLLTGWLLMLAAIVVGIGLGRSVLLTTRRASAYRSGWLDGRHAMVRALGEAAQRGMTPVDWLDAELDRDIAVLMGGESDDRPGEG